MALLTVATVPDTLTATTFAFVIPGGERWDIRSVFAQAVKDTGGAPDRSFELTVTNGTDTVSAVGATDIGTEPGTIDVTWTNAPAQASAGGAHGVVLAPFNPPGLFPGYVVTGSIVQPAGADSWTNVVVWYDLTYLRS